MLTVEEIKNALVAIEKSQQYINDKDVNAVAMELHQMIADRSDNDFVNLIDRERYFASILWQEEDIKEALLQHCIEPTPENVAKVLSVLDIKEMENCEHGWEVIEAALYNVNFE